MSRLATALPILIILFAISVFASPMTARAELPYDTVWTRQMGTEQTDSIKAVSVDNSGNIYIVGFTYGDLDGNANSGYADIIVTKYDNTGAKLWTRQIGTTAGDHAMGVAVSEDGDIYITGNTAGELDGNPFFGFVDYFLAKYDADGNKLWVKQFGGVSLDNAIDLEVDGSGNIYVTGYTEGNLYCENTTGNKDLFVSKFDQDGNELWGIQVDTLTEDYGMGITLDAGGNIYVAGYSVSVDESWVEHKDVILAKYAPDGVPAWFNNTVTAPSEVVEGIALDNSGNILITGYTDSGLYENIHAGGSDLFVSKYDNSGNRQWTRQIGTSAEDFSYDVTVDGAGNAYLSGATNGSLNGNNNIGNYDLIIVKYDHNGVYLFTQQIGTSDSDIANGVALDNYGNIIVAGQTLNGFDNNINLGADDIFVMKLSPLPVISDISSPSNSSKLPAGGNVLIAGTAEDRTGSGVSVVDVSTDGGTTWDPGYDTSGVGDWATWGYDWLSPVPGDYDLRSRATNNNSDVEPLRDGVKVTIAAEYQLTADVSPPDTGTVSFSPVHENNIYLDGDTVWVTATPNAGYALDFWSGDAAGSDNPLQLTMDTDKTVTANFSDVSLPECVITDPQTGDGISVYLTSYDITGTAQDTGSGVAYVEVSSRYDENGRLWETATDTSGDGSWSSWSFVWPIPSEGCYTIMARAVDNFGNVQAYPSIVDVSVAPEVLPSPANGSKSPAGAFMGASVAQPVEGASCGSSGYSLYLVPSISADGNRVAFEAYSPYLVPDDTNSSRDVFMKDIDAGVITRMSVTTEGYESPGNDDILLPSISADGNAVGFMTWALLSPVDQNGFRDMYVHDAAVGTTTLATVAFDGNDSDSYSGYYTSLSADGRYAAFDSAATNLVPDDTNSADDVFVRDMVAGSTERVSVSSDSSEGDCHSVNPSISGDGSKIAFSSKADNLVADDTNGGTDVFVHDRTTGETMLVSRSTGGGLAESGSGDPSFSLGGRYVAFDSAATNLAPGDTNGAVDVFVHDLRTGATERASLDSSGGEFTMSCTKPSISGDGRFVVFLMTDLQSALENQVYVHDMITGVTQQVSDAGGDKVVGAGVISADGRKIAYYSRLIYGITLPCDADYYKVEVVDNPLYVPDTTPPSSAIVGMSYGTTLTLSGVADDPYGSGVALVEVSLDGGNSWEPANVMADDGAWGFWSLGPIESCLNILTRATDNAGNVETPGPATVLVFRELTMDFLTPAVNEGGPAQIGKTITWQSVSSGGCGADEYRYQIKPEGGSWSVVRGWSSDPDWVWSPSVAGRYQVVGQVRKEGGTASVSSINSGWYEVYDPSAPAGLSDLKPDLVTPQEVNTDITWTATPSGGSGIYVFRFWIWDGTWSVQKNWTMNKYFNWTPTHMGRYQIRCDVRNLGDTGVQGTVTYPWDYVITDAAVPPCTLGSLVPTPGSPVNVDALVQWEAFVADGSGTYEFRFWVYNGSSWSVGQPWSGSATFDWTPTAPGTYRIVVQARNEGASVNVEDSINSGAFIVQ